MFAALPMYARPENRAAHDALWALIRDGLRARGLDAPDALDHDADYQAGWGRTDLVLGHICTLPWRAQHRHNTVLVGASDYGLSDTPAGYYRSLYVVRADDVARRLSDLSGRAMAVSDPLSHSGWGAAAADAGTRGVTLAPVVVTGAHRASMAAVVRGDADFASIDAQTWRVETQIDNPDVARLRVVDRTPPSPGITFVTAPGRDGTATFAAVTEAIAALPAPHRDTLGLRGIVRLPDAAYDIALPPVPDLRDIAHRA